MDRRNFLTSSALLGGLAFLRIGSHAWAAQNPNGARERLVVVFLRGAVDGLNVVVPYNEHAYYAMRPTIAIAPPRQQDGALDLDGHFGLHPQLASLMPLWKERSLAFVHACGSPDETRSHFQAQAYMESGMPGVRMASDGWLNRLLAALPAPHSATEAVNFGATMPAILKGGMPVASLPSAGGGGIGASASLPPSLLHAGFDEMYAGDDSLSVAYREGRTAHTRLMADLQQDMIEASAGAPLPRGFAQDAAHFCKLVRKDPTIQVGFFALGGWDTHVREGGVTGGLATHLRQLAEGLSVFPTQLGEDAYRNTVIVVLSEFGRTARENGNRGTDHGHANVMFVLGGPVRGGRVYGKWPGLEEHQLNEGRDLALTTDFRTVIGEAVGRQMGVRDLSRVFPGFNMPAPLHLLG